MAKVMTYECKECGCEIIVSGSHESHLRPIYCCGVEVANVSAAPKTRAAKKKTVKAAPRKAVGRIVTKKAAGKATQKKKGPGRKTTSKK
jgi:hypothetical protein